MYLTTLLEPDKQLRLGWITYEQSQFLNRQTNSANSASPQRLEASLLHHSVTESIKTDVQPSNNIQIGLINRLQNDGKSTLGIEVGFEFLVHVLTGTSGDSRALVELLDDPQWTLEGGQTTQDWSSGIKEQATKALRARAEKLNAVANHESQQTSATLSQASSQLAETMSKLNLLTRLVPDSPCLRHERKIFVPSQGEQTSLDNDLHKTLRLPINQDLQHALGRLCARAGSSGELISNDGGLTLIEDLDQVLTHMPTGLTRRGFSCESPKTSSKDRQIDRAWRIVRATPRVVLNGRGNVDCPISPSTTYITTPSTKIES